MKNHNYTIINNVLTVFVFTLFLVGCNSKQKQFDLLTSKQTGIDFINRVVDSKESSILDYLNFYNGGGLSIGDINNDSLPDIFFVGNQGKNALYLNKGNMQFENITQTAGVEGNSDWNTGSVMADVNGDGLLDIYVLAVVGLSGFEGQNELYINQGDGTFKEQAAKYGLDFDTYSSTAAFFDYDKDGDLDMYLLNQAIHTSKSYGPPSLRNKRKYEIGDRLLRNDGNYFNDVSEEAGIYGGIIGYGLGLGIADFNNDGWDDIYVSNDFFENDYYYLNNGDGTFSEKLTEYFGLASRFSMGNDMGDINGDGFIDIVTLDMLPEDEKILKASDGDNSMAIEMAKQRLGYHPQYSRNMMHINNAGKMYSEVALQCGIAATDWSWAPLLADFNQDGLLDLFVGTGIERRPNDLDYIKFISNAQVQSTLENTNLMDNLALKAMPTGKIQNYIFEGTGFEFKNQSGNWIPIDTLKSNGTSFADLDNDGDLDLVTNNCNAKPVIYKNKNTQNFNHLKIRFSYSANNLYGIGTKVYLFNHGKMQTQQLNCTRGYQSSVEPTIHFGVGTATSIDSILVIWPDNTYQKLEDVKPNQTLVLSPADNREKFAWDQMIPKHKFWFTTPDSALIVEQVHNENSYLDIVREKLIPYKISAEGPALATGDINGDGKQDFFMGAAKQQKAHLFIQNENGFSEKELPIFKEDAVYEDVDACFSDFDNDGDLDLFVVSAGGEYYNKMPALKDRLYFNDGEGNLLKNEKAIPDYFQTGSVARIIDFDHDGDLDIFVGGRAVSNRFGDIPDSYLLMNNGKGIFSIGNQPDLLKAGMVTDATWTDLNKDNNPDLILVGEWMSPKFLINENGILKDHSSSFLPERLNGLWRTITPFDFDNDGDIDYLVGNWGLNSKFRASDKLPLKLYFNDFDGNERTESVLAMENQGKYYPVNTKDQLDDQLGDFTKKKYENYREFAGQTMEDIFGRTLLKSSEILEANELQSGYLQNNEGQFQFVPFSRELQVSPINQFLIYDFNNDKKMDILTGGNFLGVFPYHGRFVSNTGTIISGSGEIFQGVYKGLNYHKKEIRKLEVIIIGNDKYLLAAPNNCKLIWNKLVSQ